MSGFQENIYQLFVATLFLVYSFVSFWARKRVPAYRCWIKVALAIVGIVGFVFYMLLGFDYIDNPTMVEIRRMCMRGILTVWITLLLCDEMRIRRV